MENTVLLCYENSIKSYSNFAFLVNALKKYQTAKTDKNKALLELTIKCSDRGLPLPSGRWGNQLAVALDMRLYDGAKYMIENVEKFGIDLSRVSSSLGGSDPWSADEVYQLSVLKFDFNPILQDDEDYINLPEARASINQNKIAAEEGRQMLVKK